MTRPLVRPVTVAEFQRMQGRIYREANVRFSSRRLISILYQTATLGIQKNARKHREPLLMAQLPDVVSRAFAVANRLKVDIEKALRFKFPGVCSYCLEAEGCRCLFRKTSENGSTPRGLFRLRKLRARKEGWPKSFRGYQILHGRIYSRQHEPFDLLHLSARLVEETAEVAEAYDTRRNDLVFLELADVFSFIFAICNYLNMNRADHELIYIDDLVWKYYPYQCRKCHKNVCCGLCGDKVGE